MSKYFQLLLAITRIDFELRYAKTRLGLMWAIVKPFFMLGIIYIVFSEFVGLKMENYVLNLLLGIILWNFFAEASSVAINDLMNKSHIITKIPLPISVIPFASCLNIFITFLINLLFFVLVLLFSSLAINWYFIIFIIIILSLFIFTLGISYILSALNIIFRDIRYIWDVVLQIGFWASPIVYLSTMVPQQYLTYYNFNPLAIIINQSRDSIINNTINFNSIIIIAVLSIVVYLIGFTIFKKMSSRIVEEI